MMTRLINESEYQRLRFVADKASTLVRFYNEADPDDGWDSEADRLWIALEEAVEEGKKY